MYTYVNLSNKKLKQVQFSDIICKFSSKKYSRKIVFAQAKLNENNFTSRVWWALIEEIAPHAEEMAGENEMASCVRGYHVYNDIWAAAIGKVLVCRSWCVVVGKIFIVKLYSCKIFSYVFCVRKCLKSELR